MFCYLQRFVQYLLILSFVFLIKPAFGQTKEVPTKRAQIQLSFAPLVKKVRPAVVNVYAAYKQNLRTPFDGDPFFEHFFSNDPFSYRKKPKSALGSGVIVDKSGLIVTNYHVIRGADKIKINLQDGQEFNCKVVLQDERTDLAVLKIDNKNVSLPILNFSNSDDVEVGDLVLAIGNPFGVGQTVTSGIVSAEARTHVGISGLDFFIQTDAAINPGNSGGALVNMKGELIGINTAIYSRSGGSVGIGFAIPANVVKKVIESIKKGQTTFDPPYLGAIFQMVTPSIAESVGMKQPYGALVTEIIKDSPAAKAGLRVGDILLSVEGQKIANPDSLAYRLLMMEIGKSLQFTYLRDGREFKVTLALEALPRPKEGKLIKIVGQNPFSGATLGDVIGTDKTNSSRSTQKGNGVSIIHIDSGSIAASFFKKGDKIRVVNGTAVSSIQDLQEMLRKGKPSMWRLEYERDGTIVQQFIHLDR